MKVGIQASTIKVDYRYLTVKVLFKCFLVLLMLKSSGSMERELFIVLNWFQINILIEYWMYWMWGLCAFYTAAPFSIVVVGSVVFS